MDKITLCNEYHADNGTFNFFLFLNREDALAKEETTNKPSGVTVHRLGVWDPAHAADYSNYC